MSKTIYFAIAFAFMTFQACGDSTTPPVDAGTDAQMTDSDFDSDSGDNIDTDTDHGDNTADSGDMVSEEDAGLEDAGDETADSANDDAGTDAGMDDGGSTTDVMDAGDGTHGTDHGDESSDAGGDDAPSSFVAVTFNTGIHPTVGSNGFTSEQKQYLDQYYGNGLSWGPAIDEARAFLQNVQADVVVFQEIFDVDQCQDIPAEARQGFVCENWTPGLPSVPELIVGSGYQVACNWHKHDKCAAVRRQFATFLGCAGDYCPDGLFGSTIPDCGNGARIGRGILDLIHGQNITLVNVHGSSGASGDDKDCRAKQVEQVFVDLGDGEPGANGARNLIMGDFNTDPRSPTALALDASARRWTDFVGPDHSFHFVNEYVKTYKNLFCIDNVVSDELAGTCWYPGFTEGHPEVSPEGYFDHTPTVCTISLP